MNKGSDAPLLPCPFCGTAPVLVHWSEEFFAPGAQEACEIPHTFVHCEKCEAGFPPVCSEAEAIAAWNTRALTKVEDTE